MKDKTLNEEEPESILIQSDSGKHGSSGSLCPGAESGLGVEWGSSQLAIPDWASVHSDPAASRQS